MREDLLFHITTKEDWQEYKSDGNYKPESLESEGFIHCSTGRQIEETANRIYPDRDRILLLVIDTTILDEKVKYEVEEETGEKYPHIYGPLSINAVIDKIEIQAENNGRFKISFTSD